MFENTTKKNRLQGKKRYIAVATLMGLVAAGGGIGALITAESTIADNKITVEGSPTPPAKAEVKVTGDKFDLQWNAAEDIPSIATKTWTITNSGNAGANVKAIDIGKQIEGEFSKDAHVDVQLVGDTSNGGFKVLQDTNLLTGINSVTPGDYYVGQNSSLKVTANIKTSNLTEKDKEQLVGTHLFDAQFDYTTEDQ